MCGFYGAVAAPGDDLRDRSPMFAEMDRRLRHRGPDDSDFYMPADGSVALGHRRLSIIDVSAAGRQPLWNEDGTVALIFNGEIYNFQALRRELSASHRFRSGTDSEVIVHGYETWGEGIVERLDGMFAFAVYDSRAHSVLLARDRLGKKPLYYADHQGAFFFASELKALMGIPDLPRALDPAAAADFLTYGYVPAPATLFTSVRKLEAGTCLHLTPRRRAMRRYWAFGGRLGENPTSEKDAIAAVRSLVEAAVEKRLVSDVPIAALLSGGVDSTVVVSAMARLSSRPVRTFTVGFETADASGKVNDDKLRARNTAARLGTVHEELTIDADAMDMREALDRVIWHQDEPNANPTLLSTIAIADAVRAAGVPVVLTGDGGDELFAGYPRYMFDRWIERALMVPRPIRSGAAALMQTLGGSTAAKGRRFLSKARSMEAATAGERYLAWRHHFTRPETFSLLAPAVLSGLGDHDPADLAARWMESVSAPAMQDRLAFTDLKMWVADESNTRLDRAMMAASVEARCPLLDHRLVEYAFSLPFAMKTRGGAPKALLKKAFADILPDEVRFGPKRGFFSPARHWVQHSLASTVVDVLSPARVEAVGLLDAGAVAAVQHGEGWQRQPKKLWALLVLQLWVERFR